ncbi:MAG TPA: hypothetical protein PLQ81_11275, partial [bacterium]|nr:hypothetical protein [bacterium]
EIISQDGNFTLSIPKGSVKSLSGIIAFSIEHNSINSVYQNLINSANNLYAQSAINEFILIKDFYYELRAYRYANGIIYDISSDFLNNQKTVAISIKYPAALSAVHSQNLVINRLNETNAEWEQVQGECLKDYINRTASVSINHFSVYNLGFSNYNDFSKTVVYPNPWTPYTGSAVLASTDNAYGIKFNGLPKNTSIKIFTVSGEQVRKISSGVYNTANWDLKNDDSKEVASGVYLYLLENNGNKRTGKIAVVK